MSHSNGVMMQVFQWYTPDDGSHWNDIAAKSQSLADAGITALWFPPCTKGRGATTNVGYGCYDLFDLGEFDQQGAVRTKYGTKAELLAAIQAAHQAGLQVYGDVVFNHKDGADEKELVWVQEVDKNDRNRILSDWYQINAWTKFTFPNRAGKYSTMQWFWWCFDALNYNADTGRDDVIYRLKEKHFSTEVSNEHGNYDYLLANDLDLGVDFVRGELLYWGEWFLAQTGVDGFRIDACKHIRSSWFPIWLSHLRSKTGKELFSVGEYWSAKVQQLHDYLFATGSVMSLFDSPLHYRFHGASQAGKGYDMRTILDGTLMKEQPTKAVTFVENHDTQFCQSLESPVQNWFKPLAYALILLRREGYPCIFHADYFGGNSFCPYGEPLISHRFLIDKFLFARQTYGYGDQHDYFDHPNTIGWVRTGDAQHPGAMAVVLTNGSDGNKWMNIYRSNKTFYDVTGHFTDKVTTNTDGWGNFRCRGGKVSVWLQE